MSTHPAYHLQHTGESDVGKSCLLLQFVRGEFASKSQATVGGVWFYTSVFVAVS